MITKELLLKIGKLAHLYVEEAEVDKFREDLGNIFDYMTQLDKVDVTNVEPMSHASGQTNVFRHDEVTPSLNIEDALSNTPDSSGRFIRVPIIIEPGTEN